MSSPLSVLFQHAELQRVDASVEVPVVLVLDSYLVHCLRLKELLEPATLCLTKMLLHHQTERRNWSLRTDCSVHEQVSRKLHLEE